MDSADYVERYAWFGAMENMQGVNVDNALMDSKGNINSLGKQYIGAAGPVTSGSGNADGPDAPGGQSSGQRASISLLAYLTMVGLLYL